MIDKFKDTAFKNALEITLEASPEIISKAVKTIIDEFKYDDLGYYSIEELESASSHYRKIVVIALEIEDIDEPVGPDDCIGIITLQSLKNNKTLLRVPPRDKWFACIKPKTLSNLQFEGHVNNKEFYLFYNEKSFISLYDRLINELKRLNFIETVPEKIWRWLREVKERLPGISF